MILPCIDCDHRKVGCHGSCHDYKVWHNRLTFGRSKMAKLGLDTGLQIRPSRKMMERKKAKKTEVEE